MACALTTALPRKNNTANGVWPHELTPQFNQNRRERGHERNQHQRLLHCRFFIVVLTV